jgi:hypothetical protein
MNYLKSNLSNSQILPYDVMKLIYEYADPIDGIRKQIDNKEYDLDEIMYNRMKKEILNRFDVYYLNRWSNQHQVTIVDKTNIDNISIRDLIINAELGYKDCYLTEHKSKNKICGMDTRYGESFCRIQMIKDLKEVKPNVRYKIRSIKQLYKLWVKL